jgi:D-methionine transport system ATP-binding protein
MIEIKNLSKTFKSKQGQVKALDGVDLFIKKKEIYGIIGLSGAGKSTLIRCINRLEEASSGEIIIGDQDILSLKRKALNELRKNMGMIFQNFNLLSSRSVYENVSLSLELKGVKKKERQQRILKILKRVGLEDKLNSPVAQLSGGQKQRVAIARALATEPEILLCDEATSALDPRTTQEILDLIKDLRDELNLTVIIITHEMSVVSQICDKVAWIDQGKIAKDGLVNQVLEDNSLFQPLERVKAV